jgi:bacterioferritin-associated ferredoxin
MYVCICLALTDGQVAQAIGQGCRSVSEVFRRVGERPNCGKCVPDLCRLVRGSRKVHAPAMADAAD